MYRQLIYTHHHPHAHHLTPAIVLALNKAKHRATCRLRTPAGTFLHTTNTSHAALRRTRPAYAAELLSNNNNNNNSTSALAILNDANSNDAQSTTPIAAADLTGLLIFSDIQLPVLHQQAQIRRLYTHNATTNNNSIAFSRANILFNFNIYNNQKWQRSASSSFCASYATASRCCSNTFAIAAQASRGQRANALAVSRML